MSIPYQDTTLPGYLFLVDDSGVPRLTIIYTSGYDSTSRQKAPENTRTPARWDGPTR
ncbi:hypothetical protein [Mycobacterium sp.]|uniref:hypothetical protein n=1 Tax=Mycobacterium sp. TaxID=1785 RepID=UPI00260930CA|nr:hypothetical protein [Mycobacterium sp.]